MIEMLIKMKFEETSLWCLRLFIYLFGRTEKSHYSLQPLKCAQFDRMKFSNYIANFLKTILFFVFSIKIFNINELR